MKPKLFKKTNLYGNVSWVCESSTHIAYGTTAEEAYAVWKSIGEGRFNAGAYNNGWTEETMRMRLACFEIKNTI